ncbi:hypothetical protein M1446_02820 [Candidatus Dependentiae bacterium]|nr:hypothetical protein [Candidatus Dependentiae bacterium]
MLKKILLLLSLFFLNIFSMETEEKKGINILWKQLEQLIDSDETIKIWGDEVQLINNINNLYIKCHRMIRAQAMFEHNFRVGNICKRLIRKLSKIVFETVCRETIETCLNEFCIKKNKDMENILICALKNFDSVSNE